MPVDYFTAESHISSYNKFRPSPPKELIDKIIEFTTEMIPLPLNLAVDVGCGSGQSTEVLAPYFKKVFGLDSSSQIILEARKKCSHLNVFYSSQSGEKMDMDAGIADVITVSQALHWLDISKFYSEADRVLKSKGVLAIYGYNLPIIVYPENKDVEMIIKKYYTDVLGQYTLPQSKKVYLDNYCAEEYNEIYFIEGGKMLRIEHFSQEIEGNISDLSGYMSSWSAFQNYMKQTSEGNGKKLLRKFEEDLMKLTNTNSSSKFKIRFQYFLLLGRKK